MSLLTKSQMLSLYHRLPVFVQNGVVAAKGILIRWERYGKAFEQALNRLLYTQWYSADALQELQFEELKSVIEDAGRHVPYYKRLFQEHGIEPRNI